MNMKAIQLILMAATDIASGAVPFVAAVLALNDVRNRMQAETRDDVTDDDLDAYRVRIETRGERIQNM